MSEGTILGGLAKVIFLAKSGLLLEYVARILLNLRKDEELRG